MDRCAICGEEGPDGRTLILRNLYDLSEISPKLIKQDDGFFRITSCKSCRADFMTLLGQWCMGEFVKADDPDAIVPVRINGATKMLTPEQYQEFKRGL